MRSFVLSFILLVSMTLVGCSSFHSRTAKNSNPVALDNTALSWESKAIISDYKNKKNVQIKMDILAAGDQYLRIDITGSLGLHLASLVYKKGRIEYFITPERKYFYGVANENSFRPLLRMPLHPVELIDAIKQQIPRGPWWDCERLNTKQPKVCFRKDQNLKITWTQQAGSQKTVVIQSADYEIRWFIDNTPTEVQFQTGAFELRKPSGFKSISLQ
ncbi:MAG: hypothetical protein ACOYOK_04250 [Pseudobdellovibrionaceae bacterium]